MTKKEFYIVARGLKVVYNKPWFLPDEDALKVWYGLLQDLPYELASAAATHYCATQKEVPTPADIREYAANLLEKSKGDKLTVAEAWGLYWDALCDSAYNAQKRFESLPEIVQRIAGSPSSMHDAAINPDTNQSVERALFEKRFRQEEERVKAEAQLPQSVREVIGQIGLLEAG